MAHFKFGKKKAKTAGANSSINSTDSSNDIGDSRPSVSSSNSTNINNHSINSPEEVFKKNMKSNMLKSKGQNNSSERHKDIKHSPLQIETPHFNGLKFFGSSGHSKTGDGENKKKPISSSPIQAQSINSVLHNSGKGHTSPPPPIPSQKFRATSNGSNNALNSPFSLQSPSFTIVANNNHSSDLQNKNDNPIHDISQISEMAQQNTGLWLTEDDLFPLKPWDRIKLPVSPFPRYRHTASNVSVTVNNNEASDNDTSTNISSDIYIIGGLNGQSVYGDTWKLRFTRSKVNNSDILDNFNKHDLDNKNNKTYKMYCNTSSIKISEQTPPPRVGHASVMCGNAFIVFGGDTHKLNKNGLMDDDLYLFNINTKKWTVPNPVGKRPQGRYGHKICVVQQSEIISRNVKASTKLYLFGGQFDDIYFNDLYSFDLSSFRKDDSHWDHIKPVNFSPPPITNHVMCNFDNKLWVFGGETPQGLLNDVFMFDPLTNDWEIVKTKANNLEDGIPAPMQEHACVVYKNLMCVYGGKDSEGNYLNDLWLFNFMTKRWFKFPSDKNAIMDKIKDNKVSPNCLEYKPIGRSGHSMTLLQKENKILIMGGDKFDYNSNVDLNDVFAVDNEYPGNDNDSNNEHIFGTTVYTFDLTCLKDFIGNIFDIKDVAVDSALDLLEVANEKQAFSQTEEKLIIVEKRIITPEKIREEQAGEKLSIMSMEKSSVGQNETLENAIEDNQVTESLARENYVKENEQSTNQYGNAGKITVNRNSFPLLSQLNEQPLVTPTEPGFAINVTNSLKDSQSELFSTSNPSNKDATGGVSDFFDTYNDDESSVQLRNSVNSGHLLVAAIKNAHGNTYSNGDVIDHDINRSEDYGDFSNINEQVGQMLDLSSAQLHNVSEIDKNLDYTQQPLSSNSTETRSQPDENSVFKQAPVNIGSSHTFTDEKDFSFNETKVEEDQVYLEANTPSNEAENARGVQPLSEQEQGDILSLESQPVSSLEKDFILEEIMKLKEETLRAASQTSKIIKSLEKQVNKLKQENSKLKDGHDLLSVQIDELNMKNMELINKTTDHDASKKQIFSALKVALSQIEQTHF